MISDKDLGEYVEATKEYAEIQKDVTLASLNAELVQDIKNRIQDLRAQYKQGKRTVTDQANKVLASIWTFRKNAPSPLVKILSGELDNLRDDCMKTRKSM